MKSLTCCIWEILPFYKILVKPWDVDRGILREAQGTLGREWLFTFKQYLKTLHVVFCYILLKKKHVKVYM
jgi:hypothetical protein